jgi:hypothetical protein
LKVKQNSFKNKKLKIMQATVKLYQVFCGLFADESIYPPYAQISNDYQPSLEKANQIYESVKAEHFNKYDVFNAANKGHKTYMKSIEVVEMPQKLYDEILNTRCEVGETTQRYLNKMVFADGVKHLEAINEELFDLDVISDNLEIVNQRQFEEA